MTVSTAPPREVEEHVIALWLPLQRVAREVFLPEAERLSGEWIVVLLERDACDPAGLRNVLGADVYEAAVTDGATAFLALVPLSCSLAFASHAPPEARAVLLAMLRAMEGIPVVVVHRFGISCITGNFGSTPRRKLPEA